VGLPIRNRDTAGILMIFSLATLFLPMLVVQTPAPAAAERTEPALDAEALREQMSNLRRTLLLGGENVNQSEQEAIRFFRSKLRSVDTRLDQIQGELVEKRTAYDMALDRAGQAADSTARDAALAEAATLQDGIQELEEESTSLQASRKALLAEIARIEKRRRDRERLAAKLDAQGATPDFVPFVPGDVGLAPAAPEPENPLLTNPELRDDFLRRYPLRGRQFLFEADPDEYWRRWPLVPPAEVLARAIPFPAPDLPGRR